MQEEIKKNVQDKMDLFINSLINQTESFIPAWNNEGFKGRWNYIDGVFLNSIVNMYKDCKDLEKTNKLKEFFINYINYYISEEGKFISYTFDEENGFVADKTGKTGYKGNELDTVCESKILYDAYELTKDDRYLKAIETSYNALTKMPRTSDGINFSHKTSYDGQIWLDGMYMYVPFYAKYALLKNDYKIFDEIVEQYKNVRRHMFDEKLCLYYHGYDSYKKVFWCKNDGCSKSFWLRSTGWFLVSIVDVLELFPEGNDKKYLISLLKEAIEGIMQYQDKESKMFYQVVDKKNETYLVPKKYLEGLKNVSYMKYGKYEDSYISNYLETSGSSMIAYTLLKGSRLGYLDKKYYQMGKEIFEAIFESKLVVTEEEFKLNDICITAGLGPDNNIIRDGSIEYYLAEPVGANDAKGVGPFIMAYLEYIK